MTDQQITDLGANASLVLNNPAFQEAFARLQQLSLEAFKRTDIRDAEGLKLARQFQAVTDDFEQILRRMVQGGKLAQVNLEKHRDEGRAARMLRTVIR